jgi:hypothetical protein
MNTKIATLAWYLTCRNPVTWSFGRWDGRAMFDIVAEVSRLEDNRWQWCTLAPGKYRRPVTISSGTENYFATARMQAEQYLQDGK